MTKLGFTMTSFVAAIPGAFLCYLLVMVCFDRFNDLSMTLKVMAVGTLLLTFLIALMPFAVLVFFRSAPAKGDDTLEEDQAVTDDDDDVAEIDDEVEPFEDNDVEPFDDNAFDDDGSDDESAEVDTFESDDEIGEVAEVADDFDVDDSEEFDFDADDDFSFDDD